MSWHLTKRSGGLLAALAGGLLPLAALGQGPGYPMPGPAATPPATPSTPTTTPPPALPEAGANEIIDEHLEALENRPVRNVKFTSILPEDEAMARNQTRVMAGQALSSAAVREDVHRMARLGRFERIEARIRLFDDSTVEVEYIFTAAPLIRDVVAVGNREVTDKELADVVGLIANTPANPFVLDQAKRRIRELYAKKGYYQADVTIDEKELKEQGVVTFRIREGDRLKITDIRLEGANSIGHKELRSKLGTRSWNLIHDGVLDETQVQKDVAALEAYYKDQGFLRAQVDRQIQLAPNGKEAILTFVVSEGPRYTVRSIIVMQESPNGSAMGSGKATTVLSPAQIAGLISLKAGDVYSAEKVKKSVKFVQDAYGAMGYADARVRSADRQSVDGPQADLVLFVAEGQRFMTDTVIVKGNDTTRSNVVRRQVKVLPDRPLSLPALEETQARLENTRLFKPGSVRVTPQQEDPRNPGYRSPLVEVAETDTGSVGFGASIGSDGGVQGNISLTQRNFDLFDWPDSLDEFIKGRAFHGGGQTFQLSAQPGAQLSNYSLSISDPYFMDSDYSAGFATAYSNRRYRQYAEDRTSLQLSSGRHFGERWGGGATLRLENVGITNIATQAAEDVFRDQGSNALTSFGLVLNRNTLDKGVRPTRGTTLSVGAERFGVAGGYSFSKLSAAASIYIPIDEDVLGNRTTLLLRSNVQWIPEDASNVPVYERYYQGGTAFRGFSVHGIGPHGPRHDNPLLTASDPVGGTYSFFFGAQVERPLVENYIAGVLFFDSGTVTNNPGFSEYRASVGFGVRLYIPQLGPVPLAFDFAQPFMRESLDKTKKFSFSLDLPFQ